MDLLYPPYPAPVLPAPTADSVAETASEQQEMVPVIEASGLVVGQAARSYVHGGSKVLHPVVHLHIINRSGDLYLQKRSMKKDLLPGFWDTAVGGHVDYGEFILEALYRESSEELRFTEYNPCLLDVYEFESETEREMVNVYACVGDFHPQPDLDEVADGRFWTMGEIEDNLGKQIFTPNFESEFVRIRKGLEALL